MSQRYKGGVISATAPTSGGPYEDGAASGIWTLEAQLQLQGAGIWPIAGNLPPFTLDVLVVAGGGGGGTSRANRYGGGGGGAGGYR